MDRLRHGGGRSTVSRRVILEALMHIGDAHITAEQLTDRIHQQHPDINESTVYRTLERFEELGITCHAHLGHGPAVWYLTDRQRRYLSCSRCGDVIDADPALFESLVAAVEDRYGFTVDFGHFAVTGMCSNCAPG
jgi:Fur family ferric uptake transcriptional regulator